MATYLELRGIFDDPTLQQRMSVAAVVAAQAALVDAEATANEREFAMAVLQAPIQWGSNMLKAALAANKDATLAQIGQVADAGLQANVDAVFPGMAAGFKGA